MENIHLIGASNQVAALEMAEPIVDDLVQLESEGIEVYDAHLKQQVRLFAPVIVILCDNGRATQLLNLCGASARKYCRMCEVNVMICNLHLVILTTPQCDKEVSPTKVCRPRTKENVLQQIAHIELSRNETARKGLRGQYGVKEGYNPLFKLGLDPFR